MKPRGQTALEIKVGVFVFLLLVLSGAVIFLLGKKSNLFEEMVPLRTSFLSASGLRVGAQVRLAGVEVGLVTGVRFPGDPRDQHVTVDLKVRSEVLPRITTDSKARIDSMGLLGDKIIDISVGVTGTPVAANAMLPGVSPPEYLQLLDTAHEVLRNVQGLTHRLNAVVTLYADPKMHGDIAASLHSLRKIIRAVEAGDGLVHSLVYDKRISQSVRALIERSAETVRGFGTAGRTLARAFAEIGRLVSSIRIEKGSTAHALLFEKDKLMAPLAQVLAKAAGAADEVADLIRKVRSSKGILYTLLEGKGGAEIVGNLVAASQTIRKLVDKVNAGQGSLGAIIADPTLYEDLKTILGNLRRNRVLRSLIRFAIQRRENHGTKPPRPAPNGAAPKGAPRAGGP
jgi:phospholipid/cholesterol/gamma-HCH transport system substrate-binding protein